MKPPILLTILFLSSCILFACVSWTPTLKAVLRRQAESKYQSCVGTKCDINQCWAESLARCKLVHQKDGSICTSRATCQLAHMEAGCGTDGAFSSRPTCKN